MRNLLLPYGSRIGGSHAPRRYFNDAYLALHPDAPIEEIDGVTGYAFWRDPVERFTSMTTFVRQYSGALIKLFPDLFSEGKEFDITGLMLPTNKMSENAFNTIPLRIRNKIARPVSDIELLYAVKTHMGEHFEFKPQRYWLDAPNMVILNFHDFENEAKRLIGIFGGDPTNVTVPVFNPKPNFIPDIPFSDDTKGFIQEMYLEDYQYDPRTPQ
jgi:hypothetical protein